MMIRKNSPLLYNIIVLLYAVFLHPHVINVVNDIKHGQSNVVVGGFLLLLLACETVVFFFKMHHFVEQYQIQKISAYRLPWVFIGLWCFRLILAGFFSLIIMQSFGVPSSSFNLFAVMLILALILKELAILVVSQAPQLFPVVGKKNRFIASSIFGEIILLLFGLISFTAYWYTIDLPSRQQVQESPVLAIIAGCLLFLVAYVPGRFIYIIEDYLRSEKNKSKVIYWSSFLFIMILTVISLLKQNELL